MSEYRRIQFIEEKENYFYHQNRASLINAFFYLVIILNYFQFLSVLRVLCGYLYLNPRLAFLPYPG